MEWQQLSDTYKAKESAGYLSSCKFMLLFVVVVFLFSKFHSQPSDHFLVTLPQSFFILYYMYVC